MNEFTPKSKIEHQQAKPERQRPPSRHGLSAEPSASRASAFVDNRPQAATQRKLQAMAQQSPRAQYLARLQAMGNNSPRQVAQRQQLQRLFGQPVQRQAGLDDEELQMQAEPGTFQRQGMEDEELVQGQFAISETSTPFKGDPGQEENHSGMPDNLKAGIENLSGMSIDDVKVHYNSSKPAQLNALAYTQGQDIEVGPGQERHLPHEGWHSVQQMQGRVQPTTQAKGVSINDDEALEHEADVMGAQAMQMSRLDQSHTTTVYPSAFALQRGSACGTPVPGAAEGAPGRGTRFDPRSPRALTHIARQANNAPPQIQRFPITVEINQERTEITEENFIEILKNNKKNKEILNAIRQKLEGKGFPKYTELISELTQIAEEKPNKWQKHSKATAKDKAIPAIERFMLKYEAAKKKVEVSNQLMDIFDQFLKSSPKFSALKDQVENEIGDKLNVETTHEPIASWVPADNRIEIPSADVTENIPRVRFNLIFEMHNALMEAHKKTLDRKAIKNDQALSALRIEWEEWQNSLKALILIRDIRQEDQGSEIDTSELRFVETKADYDTPWNIFENYLKEMVNKKHTARYDENAVSDDWAGFDKLDKLKENHKQSLEINPIEINSGELQDRKNPFG